MDNRIKLELDHLVRWAETNTACAEYAAWKAQAMAAKNPVDWSELPVLLSNAVISRSCGPKRLSITNPRRSE